MKQLNKDQINNLKIRFMKKQFLLLIAVAMVVITFSSCKDDDGKRTVTKQKGAFIIAAKGDGADYLLQTDNINEGESTIIGAGVEFTGSIINWMFHNNSAYAFNYAQGDAGLSASYVLDSEGSLQKRSDIELSVSIQTRGIFDEFIVLAQSSRNIDNPEGTFVLYNTNTQAVIQNNVFNTFDIAGNGQLAYFSDIEQVGNQIYVPFKCVTGGANGTSGMTVTIFDTLYIAVFDFNTASGKMTYNKTIKEYSERTSFIAGSSSSQHETGLSLADDGYLYAFSSAPIDASGETNLPSGVLRMKKGSDSFDENYFFNIQNASGGYHLWRVWYMGGSTFAVQMYSDINVTSGNPFRFGIVDVLAQSYTPVTGMPDPSVISSVSKPYVDKGEKYIVFGIVEGEDDFARLYIIDTNKASAVKGLKVTSDGISGIGKLTYEYQEEE